MDESFYRVQSNTVTRAGGFEIFWLTNDLLTIRLAQFSVVFDLLREDPEPSQVLDQSSNRGGGENGKVLPSAERSEENLKLFFPEIWVLHP